MGHTKLENCETCQKHSPHTCSTEILRQIAISSGSHGEAPKKVQMNLIGEYINAESKRASGDYVLQDNFINKFPFWRHSEFPYAIWYNNVNDRWMISHSKDIGTSKWIFVGPIGSLKWPHEISFKGKVLVEDNSYTTVDL